MKIIAASLESYNDELIKVVQEFWKYDYIIVGGYANEIIKQQNILRNFQIIHVEEFNDMYTDKRICFDQSAFHNNCIPIRSYNAIFMRKDKVVTQVYLDSDTISEINNEQFNISIFSNCDDPYDLENDLLDNRATYKEIVLEDNKVKTARNFAKHTKSTLVCIVDSVENIKEQLLEEYNNLDHKWKSEFSKPSGSDYNHYTVPGKIYHNTYSINYYGTEIIFVEEKDIEDVSN